MALSYSKTQPVADFKQSYGITALNVNLTANGKPFFNTDAGIKGLVSTKSLDSLRNKDLTNIRVSRVVDETGRENWMIHNVQSFQNSTTLVSL